MQAFNFQNDALTLGGGLESLASTTRRVGAGRAPGTDQEALWRSYFGPPPVAQKANFAGDVIATHNDLYQIYEGQNAFLRDTILGFILDGDWPTAVIPYFETDEMNIAFNIFEFQNSLATIVPNEGVSRLISFNKRGYQDSVQRMGIAFVMEGDLIGTYAGEIAYKRNIAGISQCCQETVNFHTIVKLLTCKDYWKEQQDLHRAGNSRALEKIEENELKDFAVLAYNRDGFTAMVERGREAIRAARGEADTLVVFPGFPYYQDMVSHGVYTEYYKTGPNGIQLLTQGPISNGVFRGIPIFETRGYSVYDNGINFQPLLRRVAVGEFYAATYDWRGQEVPANYKSDWRSIYIYSIDDDEYKKLTFASVFQHSNVFGGGLDDEGALAPQTRTLADAANAAFRKNPALWEAAHARYDPKVLHKLENVQSGVPSNRTLYQMLAHNVDRMSVEPVETFDQFDVDVITSQDFVAVAQSIVNKMFPPGSDEGLNLSISLSKSESVVRRLEAVPYDDKYFRALAYENVNRSVGIDGTFYGFQRDDQSPIMWAQNAFNALDLPLRTPSGNNVVGSSWTDPVAAVSYGWFRTIATQGAARGYSLELVDAAAEAVNAVNRITARAADTLPTSMAYLSERAPEWLQHGTPEDVMFAALFGVRPPLMLGVPASESYNAFPAGATPPNVPKRADRLRDEAAVRSGKFSGPLLWTPITPNALALPNTLPQLRTLDILIAGATSVPPYAYDNADHYHSVGGVSNLDTYLFALLQRVPITESEELRQRLLAQLEKLLNTHERKAEYAKQSLKALVDFVGALQVPAATDAETMRADVKKRIEDAGRETEKLQAAIAKQKVSGASASAQDITDGERILGFQFGTVAVNIRPAGLGVPRPNPEPGVYPMRVSEEQLAAANAVAREPLSSDSPVTRGQSLARLEERLESIGRSLYRPGDATLLTLASAKDWFDNAAKKRTKGTSAAINEAREIYESYQSVAADLDKDIAAAISKQSSPASASASSKMLDAGDEVPWGDFAAVDADAAVAAARPAVWFLSPCTNSPAFMRSMAAQSVPQPPMVLPTDVNSNYRTALIPWGVLDNQGNAKRGAATFEAIMAHISKDPAMTPITSDMTLADTKPLLSQPHVRAQLQYAPIAATFFSLDTELMANHRAAVPLGESGIRGKNTGEAPLDVNALRANARAEAERSGVRYGDEEDLAIAAEMDRRRAAGGGALGYEDDFFRAAADVRADQQRTRAAQVKRTALATMQPLESGDQFGSGLAGQFSQLSVIAEANARLHSATTQSMGFRPLSAAERRKAALRRAGVTDQFDRESVNRGFRERREAFDNEYTDYMATDDGYEPPSEEERREAAFRRAVGYDAPASTLEALRDALALHGYRPVPAPRSTAADEFGDAPERQVSSRAGAQGLRNPLLRVALLAVLGMENKYVAMTMIENDIHVPINFLVWRLWIEPQMNTCIPLQSGIETGANVLGHTNMVFSNTSADKMMHGHFTYHHATMIWNQQFVHHLKDVFPGGYIAGWNANYITSTEELSDDSRDSVIVTPLPITEAPTARKLCFIRTSTARVVPSVTTRPKQQRPLDDHSAAAFAELTWGLSEAKIANGNTGQNWNESSQRINVMAYRGTWWSYSPAEGYFGNKHHGHGHLGGSRTGPGVRSAFIGSGSTFLDDQSRIDLSLRLQ